MSVGFWKRKSFWDRCEIYGSYLAAGFTALAALLPVDYKHWPSVFAFLFISGVTLSKLRAKRIDETEKSEKARQDQEAQENWHRTFSRLKSEAEIDNQRRDEESAELRREYESRIKDVIGVLLDDLHAWYFRREDSEEKHKHRATLFACAEDAGHPGDGKRLAIYARTGVYPDSTCSWQVDDNDPDKCHGVAGKIWFHGSINVTIAACDWPADPNNLVDKARYAESLGITVDEAEGLNVKSKVFTGARIMVRGRRWGVILLDSVKEGHIHDKGPKKQRLSAYADLISSILERIES